MTDYTDLDDAICEFLSRFDGHPTNSDRLTELAGGKWRTVDARMQAMKKAGRIRWHGRAQQKHPPGVRRHGWEVIYPRRIG